jgi:hypothetical protein
VYGPKDPDPYQINTKKENERLRKGAKGRGVRERERDRKEDGEIFMFLHKLVILFPNILTYFSGV